MNSDVESLAAIAAGFRREADRLEKLRIMDIRASDTSRAIRSFDLAFKYAIRHSTARRPVGLTRAQKALFGSEV